MNTVNIRNSNRAFSDVKRFPYGFKKSGDFSIEEASILTTYGVTLTALEQGQLQPESEDEKHFVDVVQQQCEPVNKIEKTWLKYMRLSRCPKRFYTLHSSNKSGMSDAANDDYEYDYPEDDLAM